MTRAYIRCLSLICNTNGRSIYLVRTIGCHTHETCFLPFKSFILLLFVWIISIFSSCVRAREGRAACGVLMIRINLSKKWLLPVFDSFAVPWKRSKWFLMSCEYWSVISFNWSSPGECNVHSVRLQFRIPTVSVNINASEMKASAIRARNRHPNWIQQLFFLLNNGSLHNGLCHRALIGSILYVWLFQRFFSTVVARNTHTKSHRIIKWHFFRCILAEPDKRE